MVKSEIINYSKYSTGTYILLQLLWKESLVFSLRCSTVSKKNI